MNELNVRCRLVWSYYLLRHIICLRHLLHCSLQTCYHAAILPIVIHYADAADITMAFIATLYADIGH